MMTSTDQKFLQQQPGTGPLMSDVPAPVVPEYTKASEQRSAIDAQALAEGRGRLSKQWGRDTPEKVALLGILLARLEDVPFEDVALLLNVKPPRLLKLMHGEEQIQARRAERWQGIAELLENLHAVLNPKATARWLRTSIKALNGRTPLDLLTRGDTEPVLRLTASYRDSSFS